MTSCLKMSRSCFYAVRMCCLSTCVVCFFYFIPVRVIVEMRNLNESVSGHYLFKLNMNKNRNATSVLVCDCLSKQDQPRGHSLFGSVAGVAEVVAVVVAVNNVYVLCV